MCNTIIEIMEVSAMHVYYDDKYRTLIACLKDLRIRNNMTQSELAEILGSPQSYVSKYEQCQRRLDVLEVRQICICLGTSLPEFVNEFENRLNEKSK